MPPPLKLLCSPTTMPEVTLIRDQVWINFVHTVLKVAQYFLPKLLKLAGVAEAVAYSCSAENPAFCFSF